MTITPHDGCLMILGDFNAKVGEKREGDIVGSVGLGKRNENRQVLVEFCNRKNLCITNTWFEQKKSARHTWTAPN